MISIGNTVTIKLMQTNEIETYTIVGPKEIDLASGKISYNALIATQLLNRQIDDEIKLTTPSGEMEIKIDQIKCLLHVNIVSIAVINPAKCDLKISLIT